jgi:hypothetical protein
MLGGQWSDMVWPSSAEGLAGKDPETGVATEKLKYVGVASVQVPENLVCCTPIARSTAYARLD